MREYLMQLAKLLADQGISESANLVITCNDGEPATVLVRDGMTLQFFVEAEDQSRLILLTTHAL